MAELETYHTQKVEDFRELTTEYLDGEIELYEQVRTPFHYSSALPDITFAPCRSLRDSKPRDAPSNRRFTTHLPQAHASRRSMSASLSTRDWRRHRSRNHVRMSSIQHRCARSASRYRRASACSLARRRGRACLGSFSREGQRRLTSLVSGLVSHQSETGLTVRVDTI